MKKEETPAPAKTKAQTKPKPETAAEEENFSATIPSYLIIRKRMLEPVPPELIFEKEKGGRKIPFMNVMDVVDLLDERAGIWRNSITNETQIGNDFVVSVCIEVFSAEGWIGKEDCGIEEINFAGYGDTSSNAFAMAFKRAAAKHGVGRELWRKHDYFASEPAERTERQPNRQNAPNGGGTGGNQYAGERQPAGKPQNPIAATVGDLLTGKQNGMIHGRAKDLNIDANEFVNNHLACRVDELSRKAASWVIDNLGVLPVNPNAADQSAPASAASSNVANFPNPNKPESFADDAPAASAGQIKALQVTIDNVLNNAGIDESVVLAEFAAVGCRNVSFAASGEFMTENLTNPRAAALISRFNHILKTGV